MRVRWTTDAADDLERICDYIAESRPESARRVTQSVVERIGTLEAFPHLGRSGRVEGTERSPSLRFHSLRFTRSLRLRVKFGCSASYTAPNSGHQASWSREQAARADVAHGAHRREPGAQGEQFDDHRSLKAESHPGVVLTTTSKLELDKLTGEESYALEVVGGPVNRALILAEIKAATRLARTARRQASNGSGESAT